MTEIKKRYDLEERTAAFGENVISFAKELPKTVITNSIISQLIRVATSIRANYCEADCAETKKDFKHKIVICKKESKETKYWTRMIARAVTEKSDKARVLWKVERCK